MGVLPDFERQSEYLDTDMLASVSVGAIGLGRNRQTLEHLAASGIGNFNLVDPGSYEVANISQAGVKGAEVGRPKVDCVAEAIKHINQAAKVKTFQGKHNATAEVERALVAADLIIDGTDSIADACSISRLALSASVDALHLKTVAQNKQFIVTGTLKDYPACFRCIHKAANDAVENGYQPPAFFTSHRIVPESLNVKAVWVILGLLHYRAGSQLAISDIGRQFASLPAWIGFNGITENGEIFPVRAWREQLPVGWKCPDCGSVAS